VNIRRCIWKWRLKRRVVIFSLLAVLLAGGCATQNPYLYTGAGLGAAAGAGLGAAINHKNPWYGGAVGALIGGALGGVAGEAYGRSNPYYPPGSQPSQSHGYYQPSSQPQGYTQPQPAYGGYPG
jgi:hypothetical protein